MFGTVKEAVLAITDFQTARALDLSSQKDGAARVREQAHKATYRQLGEALGVAQKLLGNTKVMNAALARAGVKAADEGENEFSPIVRMLFRVAVKGGGTKPDKSAWKYGPVLRFCHESGWEPHEVASKLEGLTKEIDGQKYTKMKAAEYADRAKHGENNRDAAYEGWAFEHIHQQEGLAQIDGNAFEVEGRENGSWVALAAQWDETLGYWTVLLPLGTKSAAVKKAITKDVVESFRNYNDGLFTELAIHNAKTDKANAVSYWTAEQRAAMEKEVEAPAETTEPSEAQPAEVKA